MTDKSPLSEIRDRYPEDWMAEVAAAAGALAEAPESDPAEGAEECPLTDLL